MNQTNYYFYMKELEELRRKRDDLLQQKRKKNLTERLNTLQKSKESFTTNIQSISTSMREISEDNNSFITEDNENYIQIDFETAQQIRETVQSIKEVLSCMPEKNKLGSVKDSENNVKDFVESLKRANAEYNKVQNNCTTLIKNIERIKNGETNEMSPGETIEVLSSNKKQRERRSMLSESSFMQTFQCINLSSSSPISMNHSKRHNKENMIV